MVIRPFVFFYLHMLWKSIIESEMKNFYKLRYTVLYITLLFTVTIVHGQLPYQNDTIKIKEVVITGKAAHTDPPGYKKTTIDSSILANYSHSYTG